MNQQELEVAIQQGRLNEAAIELEQARDAAGARGDVQSLGQNLNDLGVVYSVMGRIEDARTALEYARTAFEQAGDTAGQGRALGNLGQLEVREGNSEEGIKLYSRASDLLHAAGEIEGERVTLERLARAYASEGDWLQVLATRSRVLECNPQQSASARALAALYRMPLNLMGVGKTTA